jgi:hypothetical protein
MNSSRYVLTPVVDLIYRQAHHIRLLKPVARVTLAEANEQRHWRLG